MFIVSMAMYFGEILGVAFYHISFQGPEDICNFNKGLLIVTASINMILFLCKAIPGIKYQLSEIKRLRAIIKGL